MSGLLLPNTYVKDINEPIIFLAGPIRGAPFWHEEAICYLFSREKNVTIASPQREISHSLLSAVLSSDGSNFPRQRAWERYYLDLASRKGAIMFWLPGEKEHSCEKVYGAMTRLELGQWMTRYYFDPSIRFCVGSDSEFAELHTIRYDLLLDAADKIVISTLEATCEEALRLARL